MIDERSITSKQSPRVSPRDKVRDFQRKIYQKAKQEPEKSRESQSYRDNYCHSIIAKWVNELGSLTQGTRYLRLSVNA